MLTASPKPGSAGWKFDHWEGSFGGECFLGNTSKNPIQPIYEDDTAGEDFTASCRAVFVSESQDGGVDAGKDTGTEDTGTKDAEPDGPNPLVDCNPLPTDFDVIQGAHTIHDLLNAIDPATNSSTTFAIHASAAALRGCADGSGWAHLLDAGFPSIINSLSAGSTGSVIAISGAPSTKGTLYQSKDGQPFAEITKVAGSTISTYFKSLTTDGTSYAVLGDDFGSVTLYAGTAAAGLTKQTLPSGMAPTGVFSSGLDAAHLERHR